MQNSEHNKEYNNPCKLGSLITDGHLGGTSTEGDTDSYFPELWDWLIEKFEIKSMFDIGCGLGYAQKFFHDKNICTLGIDGCKEVINKHLIPNKADLHDFNNGIYQQYNCIITLYDLIWCCEVLEHINEEYLNNVIQTIDLFSHNNYFPKKQTILAITAAPKGAGGYHHVNCQDPPYWIEKFSQIGFKYNEEYTKYGRLISPGGKSGRVASYFERNGLIFTR